MTSGWHAWAQTGGELPGPGTGSTCEKCVRRSSFVQTCLLSLLCAAPQGPPILGWEMHSKPRTTRDRAGALKVCRDMRHFERGRETRALPGNRGWSEKPRAKVTFKLNFEGCGGGNTIYRDMAMGKKGCEDSRKWQQFLKWECRH